MFTNRSTSRVLFNFFNIALILSLLIGSAAFPTSVGADNTYSMTDLGTLGGSLTHPRAINEAGQVIGFTNTAGEAAQHAFIWDDGVMIDLGTLGGSYSTPVAINEAGQVIGSATTAGNQPHAFIWQSGVMTDLGTLGGSYITPVAINEAGQVIGYAYTAGNAEQHAFVWDDGVMTDLGTLGGSTITPVAINEAGQVIGYAYTAGNAEQHAFVWDDGVMTDLGTLGGSTITPVAINEAGQVIGSATTAGNQPHAFIWQSGVMTDLGTLGGSSSSTIAINEAGQVIGYAYTAGDAEQHAFVWDDGVMTDLGTLGGSTSTPVAINEAGQVIGYATTAGNRTHAFIWQSGVMTDLGTLGGYTYPIAINEAGQVIGYAYTAGDAEQYAFVWDDGVMTDLGLGGSTSTPVAINEAGQVIGSAYTAGNAELRAFIAMAGSTLTDQTITVTTSAPVSVTNGTSFTVEATASSGLPVSYSSTGSCTNVGADFTMTSGTGTCTVMYDQAGNASYNPAPQIVEVVNAEKATLTVTADDQSKVYGSADPAFTFAYSGFVGGDGESNIDTPPTCNVTGAHVNVSNYAIACSGASDNGYTFNYVDGDLTITPKPITVTADARGKMYGDADPLLLSYQVTSGSLVGGDSLIGFLTRLPGENVGAYAILQGTLTASSNYTLTFIGADFTISKAEQTIIVTTNAPASAVIGDFFTVDATASSTLPVTYNSSGICTNAGADFTMTGSTGTCIVSYDQVGDSNYNAAPQVTENVTALSNAPDLLTPADAEQLLNNQPTFDWTDVSGAISYTIQISNNVGFTGTPTSNTVTDSTYTQPTNLPNNVTRYWRVQAIRVGGTGPWSEIRSFVTARPPSTPGLASPGNNALVTDYTPLLNWNNSNVPTGTTFQKYELQIATDNAFASPASVDVSGLVTNSEYMLVTDLDSNATYYWRVRAFNTLGQYSDWSNVRNFRTALLPPILATPIEAEQMLVNRPTFEWDDAAGATGYRIQISNNIGFTSTLTNTTVTSSTYTWTSDLPFGATLYWRVRSNGTNGPSAWSEIRSLITTNPPSVPMLASPSNNAKVSGPSPLFNWNDSTLPVGVDFDHYQIQVATSNVFTTIVHDNNVTGITNSQDNTAVLLPATTYYWRVRSFNTLGHASAWSSVRSIRIKFEGPTLTQPSAGVTVDSLIPTFTWDAVSGATNYTIQVSKNSTFSPLVINKTATGPTYTHTANLQAATTYYWRVRVRAPNTYGPGDWSQVFTFTTP